MFGSRPNVPDVLTFYLERVCQQRVCVVHKGEGTGRDTDMRVVLFTNLAWGLCATSAGDWFLYAESVYDRMMKSRVFLPLPYLPLPPVSLPPVSLLLLL